MVHEWNGKRPLLILDADSLVALPTPLAAGGQRRILIFASGAKNLVNQNSLIIRVTCESGLQAILMQDFASTLSSFPVLQQITIRLPPELARCGQARLQIDDSEDGHTFIYPVARHLGKAECNFHARLVFKHHTDPVL